MCICTLCLNSAAPSVNTSIYHQILEYLNILRAAAALIANVLYSQYYIPTQNTAAGQLFC